MHVAKAWKSVSGCGLVGVVLVGAGSWRAQRPPHACGQGLEVGEWVWLVGVVFEAVSGETLSLLTVSNFSPLRFLAAV